MGDGGVPSLVLLCFCCVGIAGGAMPLVCRRACLGCAPFDR